MLTLYKTVEDFTIPNIIQTKMILVMGLTKNPYEVTNYHFYIIIPDFFSVHYVRYRQKHYYFLFRAYLLNKKVKYMGSKLTNYLNIKINDIS